MITVIDTDTKIQSHYMVFNLIIHNPQNTDGGTVGDKRPTLKVI